MITIKEIAEITGVSNTTVSNVIHGNTSKVSKETIEKVEKVLKETNYVQRMGLMALTNKSSKMVGVIINTPRNYIGNVLADPFFGTVIGGIEQCIREAGYYMMLYSSQKEDDIYKMVAAWNVDGLIVLGFDKKKYNKLKELTLKPIVSIDMDDNDGTCFNISLQDEEGAYEMTKYLIQSGCKDIYIFANKDIGVDHKRFLGYKRALLEKGHDCIEDHFIFISDTWENRKDEYNKLLSYVNQDIALFFVTDLYAVEAIGFFAEHNIRVPEQISIVGYDDNICAHLSIPKLTTVRQQVNKKAEMAVDMLLSLLQEETINTREILLPVELIIRNSVKH